MARMTLRGAQHLPSAAYAYKVRGRDDKKAYTGTIAIYVDGSKENAVTASRRITFDDGHVIGWTGHGTLRDGRLQLRFFPPAQLASGRENSASAMPLFRRSSGAQISVTGNFQPGRTTCRMIVTTHSSSPQPVVRESWKLQMQRQVSQQRVQTVKVKRQSWNVVPLSLRAPAVVKVSLPRAGSPRAHFVRKGERPPAIVRLEDGELWCDPSGFSAHSPIGIAGAFDERLGPAWFRKFSKLDVELDWEFWFRDDDELAAPSQPVVIDRVRIPPKPFPELCDPHVTVEVHPRIVAPGEDITVTVYARASAGLEGFWWFGSGTGIAELDRAHYMAGEGVVSTSHSWTITIDTAGSYTFGANARDVIYFNNPSDGDGIPHQASSGCGLASATVEVRGPVRRSYTVAFILLAPEGTDLASDAFQQHLNKLEGIKTALPAQFSTSTYGTGECDASYPIVVLTPPGPVYDIHDGAPMWTFLREAIRDRFYTDHPDIFEFLAVYEAYPDKNIGSRHRTIRTAVAGFGINPRDDSADWGSAGRLCGIGLINDVRDLPDTYDFMGSDMYLLLHEVFGHQWGVRAPRMARAGAHFDIGLESPTFEVLHGKPWRKVDDTHFTTANVQDPDTGALKITFHPWILYIAGMMERAEVPETLMDVEPDTMPRHRYDLVETTGTYEDVTLQSIIDESGDRYDV